MHIRVVADSRNAYRPLAAMVAVCVVLMTLLQLDLSPRGQWRRTAQGWERSGAWLVAASVPAPSLQKPSIHSPANARFDTHPIAIAFAQLVGTLLALFAAAPNPNRAQRSGLLTTLSASFRASAFGS